VEPKKTNFTIEIFIRDLLYLTEDEGWFRDEHHSCHEEEHDKGAEKSAGLPQTNEGEQKDENRRTENDGGCVSQGQPPEREKQQHQSQTAHDALKFYINLKYIWLNLNFRRTWRTRNPRSPGGPKGFLPLKATMGKTAAT